MTLGGKMSCQNPNLSILVPVDLLRRPADLLQKIIRTVHYPGMEQFEIVVAHNDRNTRHDHSLIQALSAAVHVTLVSRKFYGGPVNSAFLRNRAAEVASGSMVLLLDADIFPNPPLFMESAEKVCGGCEKVVMLPCLYLTKWASRQLERGRKSAEKLLAGYFAFERRYFNHLASPSSVLAFAKDDYWTIGGFDEAFNGHGYEDFDFMLRLALHHRLIPPAADLLTNETYRAPLLAEGFRKYLGRLSLQNILERKLVFHLFHPNDRYDQYFQSREKNAQRFVEKFLPLVSENHEAQLNQMLLIDEFYRWCRMKGVAAKDYFVLFDARPGHVDRLSSWKDRLRFLVGY